MDKTRRYVKVKFVGYAPIDLAIQMHLLGKECKHNMVGEDMKPYTEYDGEYDKITVKETKHYWGLKGDEK